MSIYNNNEKNCFAVMGFLVDLVLFFTWLHKNECGCLLLFIFCLICSLNATVWFNLYIIYVVASALYSVCGVKLLSFSYSNLLKEC